MNPNNSAVENVIGLVLAAGRSARMGKPKLDLPWGNTSILGAVVSAMGIGGVRSVNIVINPLRKPAIPVYQPDIKIRWIENKEAEINDMLVSIQIGLMAMPDSCNYAMICPGDLPTISPTTIKALLEAAKQQSSELIIPSYRMRRGHPWMVKRNLWQEIIRLNKMDNVRTIFHTHKNKIFYVNIDSDPPPDIDTPEDYQQLLPHSG